MKKIISIFAMCLILVSGMILVGCKKNDKTNAPVQVENKYEFTFADCQVNFKTDGLYEIKKADKLIGYIKPVGDSKTDGVYVPEVFIGSFSISLLAIYDRASLKVESANARIEKMINNYNLEAVTQTPIGSESPKVDDPYFFTMDYIYNKSLNEDLKISFSNLKEFDATDYNWTMEAASYMDKGDLADNIERVLLLGEKLTIKKEEGGIPTRVQCTVGDTFKVSLNIKKENDKKTLYQKLISEEKDIVDGKPLYSKTESVPATCTVANGIYTITAGGQTYEAKMFYSNGDDFLPKKQYLKLNSGNKATNGSDVFVYLLINK